MPRFVLVPAHGTESDTPVFATALAVARPWAGHLAFLHVRADVETSVLLALGPDMMGSGGGAQIVARLEKDIAEREQRAERKMRDFCAREEVPLEATPGVDRVSAEWRVETGDQGTWIAAYGRVADLLVVGRTRDDGTSGVSLLETALLRTARPLLIAAAKPPEVEGATIAIAWKDTRETARAVAASLRFVEKAKRVVIFSVEEGGGARDTSAERLNRALQWHNPAVTLERLTPDGRAPVEALLEAVSTLGANLLVMGGYSHSRMREVIFGGFTRRVLRGAELPVLMAR